MCIRDSNEKIEDKKTRHIQAGRFIKTLLTEDETTTFSPLLWQSLFDYAKAVSYTHLDVYKRQIAGVTSTA